MNVFVAARTVTLRTTLLGVAIEVEAKPVSYLWRFSDGGRLKTSDPGGPYPDMTTTHVFKQQGRYRVSLTTSYSGRFRIVGSQEWTPVEGLATVASPSITVEAIETRAVLIR